MALHINIRNTKAASQNILIFIIACLFSVSLSGQENCLFDHYSTDNGLSHGSIANIFSDSEGFLWLGTLDGIDRFDGFNFKSYKTYPEDKVRLSSNRITKSFEDSYGFIWVKTFDSRVYRLNKNSEVFNDPLGAVRVEKMFLSSIGDMWLSSIDSGLYRVKTNAPNFNNTVEHKISFKGKSSNLDNNIQFLAEQLSNNTIWVGSKKGLQKLSFSTKTNRYRFEDWRGKDSIIANSFSYISYFDNGDQIFFGTSEGKLIKYSTSTGFAEIEINNQSSISSILLFNGSSLIIGTEGNGLIKYGVKSNIIEKHLFNHLVKNINSLYIDLDNNIWIETDEKGVIKANPYLTEIKHFVQETEISSIQGASMGIGFALDKNGLLWVNLKGAGFGYYNKEKDALEYFYNKPSDPLKKMTNMVTIFHFDNTGVLWLSTYNKGLEKITFTENQFIKKTVTNTNKTQFANEVRSIYETPNHKLIIGTKGGDVFLLDSALNNSSYFDQEFLNEGGLIYTTMADSKNRLWFGSKGKGIYLRDKIQTTAKSNYKYFKHNTQFPQSLSNDNVYSIVEDSKNRIWIATYGGGINLLKSIDNNGEFLNYQNCFVHYPMSIANRLRQVVEDKYGNIWLATTNGLIYFNPNTIPLDSIRFRIFRNNPENVQSLSNNDVICIHKDKEENIWIGTLGGGINKIITYPGKNIEPEFKVYTKEDGLSSNVLLGIASDYQNNLWITTESGLSLFTPANDKFRNFDKYDGLTKTSFSEATIFERESGQMLIGAFDGIYCFNPSSLEITKDTINLVITDFNILNEPESEFRTPPLVEQSKGENNPLELKFNQNMFSINYIGLNTKEPHKLQYAYILEGFDNSWNKVKNHREAKYTNIPPGKYIFKVKVLNPEITSAHEFEELYIHIKPPFWNTKLSYVIYILLLLISLEAARRIVFSFIKLRNKVHIEQELTNFKLRFFTNISHELRTPLTLIAGPVAELSCNEKLSAKGKEYIELLDRNTKRMLRLVNQLLDFRKIQNKKMKLKVTKVDIVAFVKEVESNFKELANQNKITLLTNTSKDKIDVWIDEEKIDIVFFNILSNALRYTPQYKKIRINIDHRIANGFVSIKVVDEGIGIPKEKTNLIFSRFNSVSHANPFLDSGTGIGLSFSKELIELHQGELSFESSEGQGTSFEIKLLLGYEHLKGELIEFVSNRNYSPQEPELGSYGSKHETRLQVPLTKDENGKQPKLLIVEDDAELRHFLLLFFHEKYTILEAVNGQVGLELARRELPDIIISDVMMPIMDGVELTNILKNDFLTSHIPIILLTAKSAISDRINGLKYGADDYITKPFDCDYLNARIDNILQQRHKLYQSLQLKENIVRKSDGGTIITRKDEEFLNKIIDTLATNFDNPNYKIEELSKQIGIGRTKLFTKLKALTGLSPIELLRDYRLKKSIELLHDKTLNVSEIAFMVGFNDAGYFSKCFKEKYKTSPSNYIN